ncbi:MAG: hypothetical protein WCF26_07230 [Candidatus Sulfotelmatobacter sp.]
MTNLDQIGAEAARLWHEGENCKKQAAPLVKQIWAAFNEAEEKGTTVTINGASGKTDWAKQAKISMRMCQYLVKDGNRKRSEREPGSHVTVNLDKATHVIFGGLKYEVEKVDHNPTVKQFDALTVFCKPRAYKQEEKKPIKHAKHDGYTTWCGKDAAHSNTARAQKHATCPYCIAAMAAGIRVEHPKSKSVTPEMAVEEAKTRKAEREAEKARIAALPRHIQSPVAGKGVVEMTLCGLNLEDDEIQVARGSYHPATCPACIEQSKQMGLGVKAGHEAGQVDVPMGGVN